MGTGPSLFTVALLHTMGRVFSLKLQHGPKLDTPFMLIVFCAASFKRALLSLHSVFHAHHGRAAHTALLWKVHSTTLGGSQSCIIQDGRSLTAREAWGGTGHTLQRSPSGPVNIVGSVGKHILRAGHLGQSHLRKLVRTYLSSDLVLCISWYLRVNGTSTYTCSIWNACLISSPQRRWWIF